MSVGPFVTKRLIRQAIVDISPAIENLFNLGTTSRTSVYIMAYNADGNVVDDVLGAPRSTWENDKRYDLVAQSKAEVSRDHKMDSRVVTQVMPWLLKPNDTKFGGAVWRDEIVAAASGLEWFNDQLVAEWLASAIQARVRALIQPVLDDPKIRCVPDYMR